MDITPVLQEIQNLLKEKDFSSQIAQHRVILDRLKKEKLNISQIQKLGETLLEFYKNEDVILTYAVLGLYREQYKEGLEKIQKVYLNRKTDELNHNFSKFAKEKDKGRKEKAIKELMLSFNKVQDIIKQAHERIVDQFKEFENKE